MGYGKKKDPNSGKQFDLDKSFSNIIEPAVKKAGLNCIRCDKVSNSGSIDRPMYEYILNSELVIADITTLNANAMYELGVRHALKPFSTIIIAEKNTAFPFDVNHTAIFTYEHLGSDIGATESKRCIKELSRFIKEILDKQNIDSPFYTNLGLNALSDLCKDEILRSYIYDEAFYMEHIICSLVLKWSDTNKKDKELIQKLLDNNLGNFDINITKLNGLPNSPLMLSNNHWVYSLNSSLAKKIFPKITPALIERFTKVSIEVLSEKDPKFELPKENRLMANVTGNVPSYSRDIRKGIAESVVFLSLYQEYLMDSIKQQEVSYYIVYSILNTNDWKIWGSIDNLLPIMAEASPDAFLRALKENLINSPETFSNIFDQEDSGIFGGTLISGILWGLEDIAWFPNKFGQVIECLAKLALIDKGGRFTNRPINSIETLLLPWINTTIATVDDKIGATKFLQRNYPDLLWKIIYHLLPNEYSSTSGCKKPDYFTNLTSSYKQEVSKKDYITLISFYSDIAIELMNCDVERIIKVLENLNGINPKSYDNLFQKIYNMDFSSFDNNQRYELWKKATDLVIKHRKFKDAEWKYPENIINKIIQFIDIIKPNSNLQLYKPLFERDEFDISDTVYESENMDWNQIRQIAKEKRLNALKELINEVGYLGILEIITNENIARNIGESLALLESKDADLAYLPKYLAVENENYSLFIAQYIKSRTFASGYEWLDNLNIITWERVLQIRLLINLPFEASTWTIAKKLLNTNYDEYWISYSQRPVSFDSDLTEPITCFLKQKKIGYALQCAYLSIFHNKPIEKKLIIDVLKQNMKAENPNFDRHALIELFKYLETLDDCDKEILSELEFGYYPLFQLDYENITKSLYNRLKTEPSFYMQLISYAYKREDQEGDLDLSEEQKALAQISWNILRNFKAVPGVRDDMSFDETETLLWYKNVTELAINNKRLGVTKICIGELFFHAPADSSGLWINKEIAQLYDLLENGEMRRGFSSEAINSRGAHFVDPTGDTEINIAESWNQKADELEKNGLYNFAQTAREIAKTYMSFARNNMNQE